MRQTLSINPYNTNDLNFFNITEAIPEPVFITDQKGEIVFLNRSGRMLFGFPPESSGSVIQSFLMFSHEDHNRLKSHLNTTEDQTGQYTAIKNDGSAIPVFIKTRTVNDDGLDIGMFGSITDISQLKSLEKALAAAEKRTRDIFQNTWEFWILCDFDGNILESSITQASLIMRNTPFQKAILPD